MRALLCGMCFGILLYHSPTDLNAQDLPVMDGLELWLDATDPDTVFQLSPFEDPASPGDFVESWMDKSPNEYEAFVDFSNPNAGTPVYESDGINGLPSLRFSGDFADGMLIEGLELQRPYTAFVVNQYWSDAFRGRTLQSQDINWLLGLWNGSFGHFAEGWVNSPQPEAEVGRPYVADAIGTETESFLHVNGVDWTVNSSPTGTPGMLAIGGAGRFPAEVSDADVSEIIVYNRELSGDELSSVRTHLYDKYGTTPVDGPPPPPELEVRQGLISSFTSAADLDFTGEFIYAVNVGGPGDDDFGDPLTIGDAEFVEGTNAAELDLNDAGVTMTVANEILNWHAPDYGDTLEDDNLEFAMQSIRWNVPPGVDLALGVEEGESYKLQMLFAENCCDRGFNILVEGEEVVSDFIVHQTQGGIANGEQGAAYTLELIAADDELNVTLGGSRVGVPDNNPILNVFTLEKIDAIVVDVPGDCNGDGVLDATDLACIADVSQRDIIVEGLNLLQGDLDGEGGVAFADFLILSANFGQPGGYVDGNIDLSEDGVGFSDFLIMSANFGQSGPAAVPEPGTMISALIGFLALGVLRRRTR